MAFPDYQTSGTGSVNGTDLIITKPIGLAVGNLMIAHLGTSDTGVTWTPPASWTLIRTNTTNATNACTSALYRKIADSGDVAATNFTFVANASTFHRGYISRFTGHNATTPIQDNNGQNNNTASTTCTSPGITTTSENLVAFFVTTAANASQAVSGYTLVTTPPTFLEAYDSSGASESGMAMAYGDRAAVTATGNGTATLAVSGKNIGQLVAINPSAVEILPAVFEAQVSYQAEQVNISQSTMVPVMELNVSVQDPTLTDNEPNWALQAKNTGTWTNQTKNQ